mmetsp:Transcript_107702/g.270179  ORF Transcript_107702/g.270179 Transcript_107702/m.270179 type:complete len:303 (-) Transcript_107702:444-1352(-)
MIFEVGLKPKVVPKWVTQRQLRCPGSLRQGSSWKRTQRHRRASFSNIQPWQSSNSSHPRQQSSSVSAFCICEVCVALSQRCCPTISKGAQVAVPFCGAVQAGGRAAVVSSEPTSRATTADTVAEMITVARPHLKSTLWPWPLPCGRLQGLQGQQLRPLPTAPPLPPRGDTCAGLRSPPAAEGRRPGSLRPAGFATPPSAPATTAAVAAGCGAASRKPSAVRPGRGSRRVGVGVLEGVTSKISSLPRAASPKPQMSSPKSHLISDAATGLAPADSSASMPITGKTRRQAPIKSSCKRSASKAE